MAEQKGKAKEESAPPGASFDLTNEPEERNNFSDALEYIKDRNTSYRESGEMGFDLWCTFCEDFGSWNEGIFKQIADSSSKAKAALSSLRNTLYDRAVWVNKGNRQRGIAGQLWDVINWAEYVEWPTRTTAANVNAIAYVKNRMELQRLQNSDTDLAGETLSNRDSAAEIEPLIESYKPTSSTPKTAKKMDEKIAQKAQSQGPEKTTLGEQERKNPIQPNNAQLVRDMLASLNEQDFQNAWRARVYGNAVPDGTPMSQPIQTVRAMLGYAATDYHREISALAKLIPDDAKYSGTDDPFDQKFRMFIHQCQNSGIPKDYLSRALPSMLKGRALEYYIDNQQYLVGIPILDVRAKFLAYFENAQARMNMLNEFNHITLKEWMKQNPDKTMTQNLDLMIARMRKLQYGLDQGYQNDLFLCQRLTLACETVPECRTACYAPAQSLSLYIDSIRAATAGYDRTHPHPKGAETMLVDRKFYRSGGKPPHSYQSNYQPNKQLTGVQPTPPRPSDKPFRASFKPHKMAWDNTKKCWVCGDPNCRSWKHPKEEREAATRHFMVEYEGEDEAPADDDGDEVSDDEAHITEADVAMTELGPIDAKTAYDHLVNESALHALGAGRNISEEGQKMHTPGFDQNVHVADSALITPPQNDVDVELKPMSVFVADTYHSERFYGIMIDTGAAYLSSAGMNQLLALQKQQVAELDTSKANTARFKYGKGRAYSKGTVTLHTPIGVVAFHVVDADCPFLLSLADMDRLGYYLNNVQNLMVGKTNHPIIRLNGHAFMTWGNSLSVFCTEAFATDEDTPPESQLTEVQLKQLHRRFGHPSAARLGRLLERSGRIFNREQVEQLTRFCITCQKHGRGPTRFRFTLKDDPRFNHSVLADIMYVETPATPVLHVIDEATHFQAARFLPDVSAASVWDALRMCWIDSYVGPPDLLTHDAGTQFTSPEFVAKAKAMNIETKCVPVESHHSIGVIERYHAPLRRAYDIIREELPSTNKHLGLQMAVKAVNDTAGPDGLVPTLLVFGTYPKMTQADPPHPTVLERGKAIKQAMKEIAKLHAKRDVAEALRRRNGPRTDETLDTPIGENVWVWREHKGWSGPYRLLATNDQTCTVQLRRGPTNFRITSVKPYREDNGEEEEDGEHEDKSSSEDIPEISADTTPPRERYIPPPRERHARERRLPARYTFLTTKEMNNLELAKKLRDEGTIRLLTPPFQQSRLDEAKALLGSGVFQVINREDIPTGARIFNSRFVDEIKNKGGGDPYEKSRWVIQAWGDNGKELILTEAPTIQRASQRLIICLAVILDRALCLRDISRAYTVAKTLLERDIFTKAPPGAGIGEVYLKVIRPLYGIPEAGTHWFRTYQKHHVVNLGLTTSPYDPCLLYSADAVVGLQTDDTLFTATEEYVAREEVERQKANLPAKPVQQLTDNQPIRFNGADIVKTTNGMDMRQTHHTKNLQTIVATGDINRQYLKQRAAGAYIASMTQPEASFWLSRAAQTTDPNAEHAKQLNKCLTWQKERNKHLHFVKLLPEVLKLFVFVDAAFANNDDLSSQLGFVIVAANERQNKDGTTSIKGNLIHWSSTKSKRVTRSVLASELYAMVAGFDMATVLKMTLATILNVEIPLIICTDSQSLYDCITRLGTTAEKRLMIDIMALRQSYERREITEVRWIDGQSNPADAMTKEQSCAALKTLVDTNHLTMQMSGWIVRQGNEADELAAATGKQPSDQSDSAK